MIFDLNFAEISLIFNTIYVWKDNKWDKRGMFALYSNLAEGNIVKLENTLEKSVKPITFEVLSRFYRGEIGVIKIKKLTQLEFLIKSNKREREQI